MEGVEQIVQSLKTIQDNLVGIVLPAIITAIVSFITLTVNAIIGIYQNIKKRDSEQFQIMQQLYSPFRDKIVAIWMNAYKIENCKPLYNGTIGSALLCYFSFKLDETSFRNSHKNEPIDPFENSVRDYIIAINDVQELLKTTKIPSCPILHRILSTQIRNMLSELYKEASIITRVYNHVEEKELLETEIAKCKLDRKKAESYLNVIDKWFKSY